MPKVPGAAKRRRRTVTSSCTTPTCAATTARAASSTVKLKDNHGPAKLLYASDREWAGKPSAPAARAVFASIFPRAARVSVANAWLCERVG